jgi:predicted enzyme related to lactoylglutathione lyase
MSGNPAPPDAGELELAITFFYYRDLAAAMRFYEQVMGFRLVIDQGWSKIYRVAGQARLGLVDESRGMHRAAPEKPVQLCLRVPDVDAWHAHIRACGVAGLTQPRENAGLGIRAFVFEDPEGYQIEIQSATRLGA